MDDLEEATSPREERTGDSDAASGADAPAQAAHRTGAGATRGSERAEALCREAARVASAEGGSAEAVALWRRALLSDPHHAEAIDALRRVAVETGDTLRIALLDTRRFENETDPGRRARIALEQARRERDALHHPAAARAWLERGVAASPDDASLREAFAAVLRERGEEQPLLEQLEAWARICGDATPASVRVEAAALRSARGDSALALAHLQCASALAPDDATVVDALVETLTPLGRPGDLADALERRIALAEGDADLSVALLTRLATTHETRLFDPEAALDAYERAHALGADEPVVGEAIARLRAKREAADATGDVDQSGAVAAVASYEREAEVTSDRERLGVLVREIERLHTRLGAPERALPWVQRWVGAAPEEPDALRALARLHDRPGSETPLAATLEALDRLLPPAEQLPNRQRLAQLYLALDRRGDAARAFARVLDLAPDDLRALEGRVEALRTLEDEAALAAALERLVAHLPAADRQPRRFELACLYENAGDLARAIAVLELAEREGGSDRDATERLDDLLARMLRHEDLVARLARRAEAHDPGTAEAVAIDLRRAGILLEGLQRCDEAAEVYRRALEHAPESREARTGLERALRSSVDAAGLAEFLEDQEGLAEDPAERDRLTLERAVLLDDLLDRPEDALGLFLRLVSGSEVPDVRRDARDRAEDLLARLERWPALCQLLEEQLGQGEAREDAKLHERLARLCADRLDDAAAELAHLERVVALEPERVDVWQALASRYEMEARDADHARALEAELACGPDHVRELGLRARLAGLYEGALAQPERVREHYERVFELSPLHNGATHYLIDAYEREERFEDVVALLETRLAAIDAGPEADSHAPRRRTALRLQIAELRESRLDDAEGAISALEVALEEVGPDPVIAEPLAAAYQRAGYAADLVDLCERAAAESAPPEERANWLVRLGDAHLASGDAVAAADAYRRALTERPGDRAVEASLRELYRRLERREPLCELLEAELRHLAGTAEIPVRVELLELVRESRPADALLHAQRILELAPRHADAFGAALELAETLQLPDRALELVETRLASTRSSAEAADLELRRARLLAGPLARPEDAIASYRAALEHDPGAAPGMRPELATLLERERRYEEWLTCWEQMLREAPPEERAARIDRAALVAWEQLSPAHALPWLERLRIERPDDRDVLARITRAHREAGDEEALIRALEAEAAASPDPALRRRCHIERASLLKGSGARGRALAALAEAGPDREVLLQCEALERELGLHERRAVTLQALLTASGPDLAILRDLAQLYREELGEPAQALRHLETARERVAPGSGADIEILRAMADAAREAGRIDLWARHAETELSVLSPEPVFDDRRRELRSELAQAYDERLARPGLALGHLRILLETGDEALLGDERRDRLERSALRLLRAEGDVVELERRLAARLDRLGGGAGEWIELGELREERLRHVASAQDAYRRASEADPRSVEALRGLRRTAEILGRWSDVAAALERELEVDSGREATGRGALLRALGDIYWHRLSSTTRASRCYAGALEANPSDFAALRALERLLEAMEDWRGALELYESEVEVLGDANPRRRREIWIHVAGLARERAGDAERARQALLRAAEIEPLGAAHLADLAALHEALGDAEGFAESFGAWCDLPESGATADDHLRLALVLEERGRIDAALERIERAAARDAGNAAIWDAAARLRAGLGDRAGSTEALRHAASRLDDSAAADRLFEAATGLFDEDPRGALELLREAATRRPHDGRVQAARAELAAAQGEHAEAEEAAVAALGNHEGFLDRGERVRAARTGGIAARARGRLEAASGLLSEALRLDPEDAGALGASGETLVALGDHANARGALERRLDGADPYPERARHRALLGICLAHAGETEEAVGHYEAALEDDPRDAVGLEGYCEALERLDRIEPGVRALERWASCAREGNARAERLLRAAEWELRRGEREASAERHLRDATLADPDLARAWILLAQRQLDAGRADEVVETTDRAASRLHDPVDLAAAAQLQGAALEQRGDRRDAAELYRIAAECDPRRAEAALLHARLLRGFGEWREAAAALATFAERHPGDDDATLAEVHEQLGRLRAGPLEDLTGAVLSYRRAIELAPERIDARASLAELLSHRPGDWDECLAHLRAVLAVRPTHANSLRVAQRIARGREDAAHAATGVAIQRALGVASAYEVEPGDSEAAPFVTEPPALSDPRFERLRRVAVEASAEIATALGTEGAAPGTDDSDEIVAFRSRILALQGELAAPSLLLRSSEDVGCVLGLIVELVLEPAHVSGDGNLVNALAEALGRRRRRKLRRILGESALPGDFADVDWAAWRTEMRALAAAEALRRDGAPLRTALVALIAETGDAPDLREETVLAPHVERDPTARSLLARVLDDWMGRL